MTRRQAWEEIRRTGQHSKGSVARWRPQKEEVLRNHERSTLVNLFDLK
jgi:hypothetical protein